MADGWKPRYLVLHDYGGTPKNKDGVFNPYNGLVFPDGSVRYRHPRNPYGTRAPHAYKLNPYSVGLSYAGQVGSKPTPAALDALRREYKRVTEMYPGIKTMSHGEAYQATKGTRWRASKLGRGLDEAGWRTDVLKYNPATDAAAPQTLEYQPGRDGTPAQLATPVSQRGLTTHAGLSQPAPAGAAALPGTRGSLQSFYGGNAGMDPAAGPMAGAQPPPPLPAPARQRPAIAAMSAPPAPMGALAQRGPAQPEIGTMHGFGVEQPQPQQQPLQTQPTPVTPAQPARQDQQVASANIATATPAPSPIATEVAPKPEAAPVTRAGASATANVGSVAPAAPSSTGSVDPVTKATATALQSPTWDWQNGQLGVMWPGNKMRKPSFTGFGS